MYSLFSMSHFQASKEVDWINRPFRETIEKLGKWIHGSADRFAIWRKHREETKEGGHALTMPFDTRWLTVDKACEALVSSLVTTAKTLESAGDADAMGILHQLLSVKFLMVLLTFCDAMPALSKLSLTFQREDLDVSMVEPRVRDTKGVVERLIDHPGINCKATACHTMRYCGQASTSTHSTRRLLGSKAVASTCATQISCERRACRCANSGFGPIKSTASFRASTFWWL